MRVFLDTNVLVAAFATRGICPDLFRAVLLEHDLITGEPVLQELNRVLLRELKFPGAQTREIILFLRDQAQVAKPKKADTGRRPIRTIAGSSRQRPRGKAEILVTGDTDLLEAKGQSGIRVVSPRGFWQLLKKK